MSSMTSKHTTLAMFLTLCLASCTPRYERPHPGYTTPEHDPDRPVTIQQEPRESSWLEAPSDERQVRVGPGELLAFGANTAIHKTSWGLFATDSRHGVIGPVTLPDQAVWVGVDGADRVWAATAHDGKIYVAPDAKAAARATNFKQIRQFEGARAWDTNINTTIVGAGDQLHITRDAGATWHSRRVREGLSILKAFVRHDGVMVVIGSSVFDMTHPLTVTSRDGGDTWMNAEFQPKDLRRDGSWIWNADWSCVGVLDASGKHWSSNPDLSALPGAEDPRNHWLTLATTLANKRRGANIATLVTPPPPAHDPKQTHKGRDGQCQDPIPTAAQLRGTETAPARGLQPLPCQGVQCLLATRPAATHPTRHQTFLFSDAACAERGGCTAPHDAPHVGLFDRDEGLTQAAPLPPECTPHLLTNERGLTLLVCAGEPARIWTKAPRRGWNFEEELPIAGQDLDGSTSASDGTLLLFGGCGDTGCKPVFLRSPVESGAERAWTEMSVPDLLTAVAIPGDQALLVAAPTTSSSAAQLWLVTSGRKLIPWVEVVGVEEPVERLEVTPEGQIRLWVGDDVSPVPMIVMGDGRLER